ncbi:helix-turn-helix domain-containing protein [Rhizorhapis sp. SPR117]|uniref:helix-turn-helix domain-containing protein n=1 Tax=Rhizorhapis sp. SPR117 TaxID=2912611 RepID=UPI001F482B2C|nr:helix-turn-helix transcriptional regulator [Rhizorhapis sp. SPR117]
MTVQIVEIAGQKMAMLPIDDYQKLLDIVEDRADALAAVAAEQRRLTGEEYLPAEMVDRIMGGESALRVWRKYRGMTLEQVGKRTGIGKSYLSEIETGNRQGKPALWRALAEALDVSIDDILPLE